MMLDKETFNHLVDHDDLETILNEFLAFMYNYNGETVEVEKEVVEAVKAAQERLNNLALMDQEAIEKTAREYNEVLAQGNTAEDTERNERIQELTSQIAGLQILLDESCISEEQCSTDEALFILGDLSESLRSLEVPSLLGILPEEPADVWYQREVAAATEHLQRKIAQYQREVGRVEEVNAAIGLIKDCLRNS